MNLKLNGLRTGIAALIVGLVVSQGALADRELNTETVSRTIDVSALNLSSQAGAQEAYKRITTAALSICSKSISGERGVARVKAQREVVRPCVDAAVKGALDQVVKTTGIDLEKLAGSNHDRLVAER